MDGIRKAKWLLLVSLWFVSLTQAVHNATGNAQYFEEAPSGMPEDIQKNFKNSPQVPALSPHEEKRIVPYQPPQAKSPLPQGEKYIVPYQPPQPKLPSPQDGKGSLPHQDHHKRNQSPIKIKGKAISLQPNAIHSIFSELWQSEDIFSALKKKKDLLFTDESSDRGIYFKNGTFYFGIMNNFDSDPHQQIFYEISLDHHIFVKLSKNIVEKQFEPLDTTDPTDTKQPTPIAQTQPSDKPNNTGASRALIGLEIIKATPPILAAIAPILTICHAIYKTYSDYKEKEINDEAKKRLGELSSWKRAGEAICNFGSNLIGSINGFGRGVKEIILGGKGLEMVKGLVGFFR